LGSAAKEVNKFENKFSTIEISARWGGHGGVKMKRNRKGKIAADLMIILCSLVLGGFVFMRLWNREWSYLLLAILGMVVLATCVDLSCLSRKMGVLKNERMDVGKAERLILLDEEGKPVKSWDLAGRTALILGKSGGEDVDIDLTDCEYSCFIDYQHAVLNFCLDCWYVEDLESQNGVKIKKVEDGQCYKVMGHPCRVTAGDILYIANTRLLFS